MANRLSNFYPVIVAGGRGTRFWPLSRKRRAKQLLALDGKRSMIQQTVSRLLPLSSARQFWIVTNQDLEREIRKQLPQIRRSQIIAEPIGRNTAPAIGLAAFILMRKDPNAIIGMFPADHVIDDEKAFHSTIAKGIEIAAAGDNIVVIGIPATRPETGYGYIEAVPGGIKSLRVRRFTEKPDAARAAAFIAAGNYFWNSGMFLWSARTLTNALIEHLPKTAAILQQIAAAFGRQSFAATFQKLYPKCENISIDYAVLEPRSARGGRESKIFCLPASFGWNDLGSWRALHEHQLSRLHPPDDNIISSAGMYTLSSSGNYVSAPAKFVATIGVNNLVVVDTGDALLITTRDQAQNVGKVVQYLDQKKLSKLT